MSVALVVVQDINPLHLGRFSLLAHGMVNLQMGNQAFELRLMSWGRKCPLLGGVGADGWLNFPV